MYTEGDMHKAFNLGQEYSNAYYSNGDINYLKRDHIDNQFRELVELRKNQAKEE